MPLATPDITTLAGATVAVSLLVEIITRAWNPPGPILERWGPVVAVLVGIIVVLAGGFAAGSTDVIGEILTGIFAGAASMGLQNVVTQTVIAPSA